MAMTSFNSNEWAKLGFKDFVVEEFVSAPFTQVVNRALVSNTLKTAFGVERVRVDDIQHVENEFGPNGEQVWEADSKDTRIRFVGNGWTNTNSEYGLPINTATVGDFFEITFYGTGLNLLLHTNNAAYDYRATIDGGVEGANLHVGGTNYSNALGGRNYKPNATIVVASGLSATWHTAKIRMAAAGIMLFGFEVYNERADLLFPVGSIFSGQRKESLATNGSSSYNTGIVGTRGARVVKYIKDGAISQAIQEVDATQQNLSSATHANEEITRVIDWREFGNNLSSDFSTLTSVSNRSFTLNDGTTSLIATSVARAPQVTVDAALQMTATNSFVTIQFVGTGLDVVSYGDGVNPPDNHTFSVDGTSIGTLNPATTLNVLTQRRVVSGLPYGTHVVKINRDATAGGSAFNFKRFIVYGPKKPVIPEGAIELADYCVMANFAANTVAGTNTIATGVLRKALVREQTYLNTWNLTAFDSQTTSGAFIQGQTNGGYHEYTFYGTGFEYRMNQPSSTATANLTLNGIALTSGNFPTVASSTYGSGMSFTVGTGALSITNSGGYGQGLRISNLPLAKYTLRVTLTNTAGWNFESIDIITPIHSHAPGFNVGSLALLDKRETAPTPKEPRKVDLAKAKAWITFRTISGIPKIHDSHNIAALFRITTGQFIVYFDKPFKNSNYIFSGGGYESQLYTNGLQRPTYHEFALANTAGVVEDPEGAGGADVVENIIYFGELADEEGNS